MFTYYWHFCYGVLFTSLLCQDKISAFKGVSGFCPGAEFNVEAIFSWIMAYEVCGLVGRFENLRLQS